MPVMFKPIKVKIDTIAVDNIIERTNGFVTILSNKKSIFAIKISPK
ncbi:hypothetical protein OENI_10181 [Oenococcus oeni]|nr:hypothetical protein OENI_10181 [Oenococcus oeni]